MPPTRVHMARWVLPIASDPLPEGAVARRGGTIVDLGPARAVRLRHPEAEVVDLGKAILLPGLVNAHSHLSLTGLGGRTPRGAGFLDWLGRTARATRLLEPAEVRRATREGLDECHRLGTAAVGEIAARPEGVEEILSHPHLRVRVYFEFLGVSEGRARERFAEARRRALDLAAAAAALGLDRVRPGLSPHAPYSVWPTQWREAADFARDHDLLWTSHVAEPPEEEEFLRQGTGPLRDYLIGLGVWDGAFPIPGRPAIEMLAEQGALGPRALLVHAIHLEPGAMARVARSGASVCLCPRSNAFLGLPPAPVEALENAGVQLCLGTDARASNEDLSVWAEMRALAALAPGIPAQRILEMATTAGARALGFEGLAGTIRIGDRSPLVAVRMEAEDGDPIRALLAEGVEDALLPL